MKTNSKSRRDFLRNAAFAGVGGSMFSTMGLLQRAQAAAAGTDYKALVCVYLAGGADSCNLIAPNTDRANPAEDYRVYLESRSGDTNNGSGGMAVPRADLLNLSGVPYGLHPGMEGLQALFNSNKLAAVANVGTLVEPSTKDQVINNLVGLPSQLFSHSDQAQQWEKGYPQGSQPKGWLGKVADLVDDQNAKPAPSMNISLAGNNVLQVGDVVLPYSMNRYDYDAAEPDRSSGGPIELFTGYARPEEAREAIEAIMATANNKFGRAYSEVKQRGIANFDLVSSALEQVPFVDAFAPYNNDQFQQQLHMVARMIAIQSQLGAARQTYFVQLGGWDTHQDQLTDLPELTQRLSAGLSMFHQATMDLGVEDQVTAFTFTEFGRTLNSNGNGTDHGWGGHQFVMGGAVNGGDIYGTMPDLTLEGPDDMGRGRIVPTLAVEQYGATLARWFGVDNGDLGLVFPNLNRFGSSNLGFMA